MNVQTVIAVLCLICLAVIIRYKQRAAREQQPFFDSARLQGEVNELHRCMNELEQLDAMIIDLRLCKPDELHKAFRIQWQGSTGRQHALDFMSTGANGNTRHMIALAESQREELNEEIQSRIVDLYTRAQSMEMYSLYDAERVGSGMECSYTNGEQYVPAGERIARKLFAFRGFRSRSAADPAEDLGEDPEQLCTDEQPDREQLERGTLYAVRH